jgi:hypothetical protein
MTGNPYSYRLHVYHPSRGESIRSASTYIIRNKDGRVSYISSDETPLALYSLIINDAARIRFRLEDALDGNDAAKELREALLRQYANNKPLMPIVEVFS